MTEILKKDIKMWELFTKKEEYNPIYLDKYNRYPYFLSQNRNVLEPKVSKYLIENGFNPTYPEGKTFAVCLTHDIDLIYENWTDCAFNSIKSIMQKNAIDFIKHSYYLINKKKHPYWNFKKIMDIEKRYNAKSSFYFLALDIDNYDYRYSLEEIYDDMQYILKRGWEIGLHGSHEAYKDISVLKKEKNKIENVLGKKVIGYRNHYLHFKTPLTWEILSEAGFKYDTTYGYPNCVGFRNGMCHPFKPFNLETEKEIEIIEIPLIIMDCTLLGNYMQLNADDAWNLVKEIIDKIEKYKGVITILWHNTYMIGEKLEFYEKILKYCHDKNAWMTSAEQIYNWVNK